MLEWSPAEYWLLSPSVQMSRAQFYGQQNGRKIELQSHLSLPEQLTLGVSASTYSTGYRELNEAMDAESQRYQSARNTSLNWNNAWVGSLSFQYSENAGDEESSSSRYLMVSWGKSLGHTSLSVNWQHALSSSETEKGGTSDGDLLYLNLVIPFGTERISTYMRSRGENKTSVFRTADRGVKTPITTSRSIATIRTRPSRLTAMLAPTCTTHSWAWPQG